jgi:hypothetical protein
MGAETSASRETAIHPGEREVGLVANAPSAALIPHLHARVSTFLL